MTLPQRYLVDYARRKGFGNIPFPCFYCLNNTMSDSAVIGRDGCVESFGTEANVPMTCQAGLTCPTDGNDCKAMQLLALPSDYRRIYPPSLFEMFARDYYMEMLSTIYREQPIPRKKLVDRKRKGYHTREQRISDMLAENVAVASYNVSNEEQYALTNLGESIAEQINQLIENYLLIKEEGELMDQDKPFEVFGWIREHPDCTKRQIYDHFSEMREVELVLDDLEDQGYVEPMYDEEHIIRYNATRRGVMIWNAIGSGTLSARSVED